MGHPIEPTTPARLAWARSHPDATDLANRISNLAAQEPGVEDPAAIRQINEALMGVRQRVHDMAGRYKLAGLQAVEPDYDPASRTRPMGYWPWPLVGLVVAMWSECSDPAERIELAERATVAANDAAHRTPVGKLNGTPFPDA